MPGSSRQHRSEKRRKELARQAKQAEKRQRRADDKGSAGAGPPIDWNEAAPGVPLPPEVEAAPRDQDDLPDASDEPKPE
jgi:hypothetical protein